MKKFLLLFALAVVAMPCGAHCPCPSNEIWYTNGSTTEPTKPRNTFGVNIISNTYYAENECWVIKFDGDVTSIGEWAFEDCSNLTSVTIPDSVTTIGFQAFKDCSNLTSITIPDSVTRIGGSAFSGCRSLTSITIPDSVTSIGEWAFQHCSSLTSVYCKPTIPPILGDYALSNIASSRKIYVPMQSVEQYKKSNGWEKYKDAIEGYNF